MEKRTEGEKEKRGEWSVVSEIQKMDKGKEKNVHCKSEEQRKKRGKGGGGFR